MAEVASLAPNADLLEWPKKDKRRFLHVVYRVGDLDRTIKYDSIIWHNEFFILHLIVLILCLLFRFYTECFGMKLLRKRDVPEEKYSNAFLGFGPEDSNFVVELTYSMNPSFIRFIMLTHISDYVLRFA